jgi:hypothetical protein
LITVLPPTWPQYTDAGFAIPVAFCTGAAVVTTTFAVGTGVATVVEGVVAGWFDVHPAVIRTAAITRTSISEDVFIQLIKISPAQIWAGKLFMRYGLTSGKLCLIAKSDEFLSYFTFT